MTEYRNVVYIGSDKDIDGLDDGYEGSNDHRRGNVK